MPSPAKSEIWPILTKEYIIYKCIYDNDKANNNHIIWQEKRWWERNEREWFFTIIHLHKLWVIWWCLISQIWVSRNKQNNPQFGQFRVKVQWTAIKTLELSFWKIHKTSYYKSAIFDTPVCLPVKGNMGFDIVKTYISYRFYIFFTEI